MLGTGIGYNNYYAISPVQFSVDFIDFYSFRSFSLSKLSRECEFSDSGQSQLIVRTSKLIHDDAQPQDQTYRSTCSLLMASWCRSIYKIFHQSIVATPYCHPIWLGPTSQPKAKCKNFIPSGFLGIFSSLIIVHLKRHYIQIVKLCR